MPITPRPDQIQQLVERAPEGKLYMLNLLKFRDTAAYADGRDADISGREAYGLYALGVGKLLHELGGRIVWAGVANTLVIGDGDLAWDQVALVEYPSIDAFREMTASAAYQDIHVHREAGRAHQFRINCLSADQAMAALG